MSDTTGTRSTVSLTDGLPRNRRQSPPIGLSDTLGPVATALASSLIGTGRRQLAIANVQELFLAADPTAVGAPDGRTRLADTLATLAEVGVLEVPRSGWDTTQQPPLPATVRVAAVHLPQRPTVRRITLRPELKWAANLSLNPRQAEELTAISRFLRDRTDAPIVPVRERSLELFGDEKRLEQLARTDWFGPNRLRLEQLRCEPVAPPFAWQPLGDADNRDDGPVLLAVENHTTYHTLARLLAGQPTQPSPVSAIAFAGGTSFIASVASAATLPTPPRRILYYGDLDDNGLRIPAAAAEAALAVGLPAPVPAVGLYRLLLRVGRLAPAAACPPALAVERADWLPPPLRPAVIELLVRGRRLAQEWTGVEVLTANPAWRSLEALELEGEL
jgi:hypothetical protein